MAIATWIIFALALGTGLLLPAPPKLPGVALGSTELLGLERVLALFFGGLLILSPLLRGGIRGELALKISPRSGAEREAELARVAGRSAEPVARMRRRLTALEDGQAELAATMAATAILAEQAAEAIEESAGEQ